MAKQYKIDAVTDLVNKLKEKQNIILTDYSGIKVEELHKLRRSLGEKDIDYKVVKNSLFSRALKDAGFPDINEHLVGPIGVVFAKEDLSEAAQVIKNFSKEQENFEFSLGVMDNEIYGKDQLKKIADIPSREELLAQIMSLLNGPATNMAMMQKQVMSSLARGIKAVAEQNQQSA
ncbi:MAG TPA: 50S ribosomal protein L10 [Spirochaetota bacterium]|nr:50S ribosomal protein L10 [Spirochaetota bacterium]